MIKKFVSYVYQQFKNEEVREIYEKGKGQLRQGYEERLRTQLRNEELYAELAYYLCKRGVFKDIEGIISEIKLRILDLGKLDNLIKKENKLFEKIFSVCFMDILLIMGPKSTVFVVLYVVRNANIKNEDDFYYKISEITAEQNRCLGEALPAFREAIINAPLWIWF